MHNLSDPFLNMPHPQLQHKDRVHDAALSSGVGLSYPSVPTVPGHVEVSLVAERAALVALHVQGCCTVVARSVDGWVCLSCDDIHVITGLGNYSPARYRRKERVLNNRAARAALYDHCGQGFDAGKAVFTVPSAH